MMPSADLLLGRHRMGRGVDLLTVLDVYFVKGTLTVMQSDGMDDSAGSFPFALS